MYPDGLRIASRADIEAIERRPLAARLRFANIYDALRATADRQPGKLAIRFLPGGSADDIPRDITYGELIAAITQAANLFHDLGVGATDVVSLLLPILPECEIALWGAETAGIANPINPFLEPSQLTGLLRAAGTKVLVTTGPSAGDGVWQKIEAIRHELPDLKTVLSVGEAGDNGPVARFETALTRFPGDRLASRRQFRPDDIAAYFHTGGTTGLPKLARQSHRAQVVQAWNTGAMVGIDATTVIMIGLPFFHVGNSIVASLRGLMIGETLLLLSPSGFRNPTVIRDYWRIVERFKATIIGGVPTSLAAVLDTPPATSDISSVRICFSGGAAAPVDLLRQFKDRLGIAINEGWGMTETTSFATLNPGGGEVRIGSVGLTVPYHRIKIVELDEAAGFRRECEAGEVGQVVISGPGLFAGYVDDAHNANSHVAGLPAPGRWFITGDLGRLDADGYLWLTGRAKDVIIRGGHNIDPQVIEETLSRHPEVQMAAAVGMIDRHAGELPVAYVQLTPGAGATGEDIMAHVRAHIPERAAAPVRIEIREALPLTAIGKIFKPELRRDAARLALLAALAPLRAGTAMAFAVTVAPDPRHGTVATLEIDPATVSDSARTESEIHDLLGRFVIRYRIIWTEASPA